MPPRKYRIRGPIRDMAGLFNDPLPLRAEALRLLETYDLNHRGMRISATEAAAAYYVLAARTLQRTDLLERTVAEISGVPASRLYKAVHAIEKQACIVSNPLEREKILLSGVFWLQLGSSDYEAVTQGATRLLRSWNLKHVCPTGEVAAVVYLVCLHVGCHRTLKAVGHAFGVGDTCVAHALKIVRARPGVPAEHFNSNSIQ